jgi:parallel beta-helix repeat protein
MLHRSPARRRAHVIFAVLLTTLAGGIALVSVPGSSTASRADWVTVVDEPFDAAEAADRFKEIRGRWTVERGAYRLHRPLPRSRDPRPAALTLLRTAVTGDDWRLGVAARASGRSPELALVVGYGGAAGYWLVHLAQRPRDNAVFRVRDGVVSRVGRLTQAFRPDLDHRIELRMEAHKLRVLFGPSSDRLQLAGEVRMPNAAGRVGLGSWRSSLALSSVRLEVTGPTTGSPTTSSPGSTPTGTPTTVPPVTPGPGGRSVAVTTSAELTAALADAQPGDVITMADGIYTTKGLAAPLELGGKHYVGTFVASTSGTERQPIILQGSRNAVIDGKPGEIGTGTQYGLYLAEADHWSLRGFTIRNVSKGLVLDRSHHNRLESLRVTETGQEGIHLRSFSSDNVVTGNVVDHTGLKTATYGEGIYVGSANSNWATYSGGQPDRSDRNQIIGNSVSMTGAESIDVKEGTTGGVIADNIFDGAGMSGSWADSWIDMKGNAWVVEDNTGANALEDGFQVHGALTGWGNDNVFRDNVADVNGPGYGFWLQNNVTGNVVTCTNSVSRAASGFANTPCG